MTRWKVVATRNIDDACAGGYDSSGAWAVDLENVDTGARHTARVDLAGGRRLEDVPPVCRRAVVTRGRSALIPFLNDERLPSRLVLARTGIVVSADRPE